MLTACCARPRPASLLSPGAFFAMDSPAFAFSPGWQVTAAGADPVEPGRPGDNASGSVEFHYQGQELALQVATGDYRGYLFVTVDGRPANLLHGGRCTRQHRRSSRLQTVLRTGASDAPAGVRSPMGAGASCRRRQPAHGTHRSLAQLGTDALRGVAIDALPPAAAPRWPALLLGAAGIWLLATPWSRRSANTLSWRQRLPLISPPPAVIRYSLLGVGLPLAAAGTLNLGQWLLLASGLSLLALAALFQPVLWLALLLLATPFDYGVKAVLLPGASSVSSTLALPGLDDPDSARIAGGPACRAVPLSHRLNCPACVCSGGHSHSVVAVAAAAADRHLGGGDGVRRPLPGAGAVANAFSGPLLVGGLLIVILAIPARSAICAGWWAGGWRVRCLPRALGWRAIWLAAPGWSRRKGCAGFWAVRLAQQPGALSRPVTRWR